MYEPLATCPYGEPDSLIVTAGDRHQRPLWPRKERTLIDGDSGCELNIEIYLHYNGMGAGFYWLPATLNRNLLIH